MKPEQTCDLENLQFSISEVSQLLNISASAIRFYEKKGLITPTRDSSSQYRYYNYKMLITLVDILHYRELGIPVDKVKEMFYSPVNEALLFMDETIDRTHQQIIRMQSALQRLILFERKIRQYKDFLSQNTYTVVDKPWCSKGFLFEDREDIQRFIENYDNVDFGLLISADGDTYQRCVIDPSIKWHKERCIWDIADHSGQYLEWLMQMDYGITENNNMSETLAYMKENNMIPGRTISFFLLNDSPDQKKSHDYYMAWTEIL